MTSADAISAIWGDLPSPIPLAPGLCYLSAAVSPDIDGCFGRLIVSVEGNAVHYVSVDWPVGRLFCGAMSCSKAVYRRWAKGGRCLTQAETARLTRNDEVQVAVLMSTAVAREQLRQALAGYSDRQLLTEACRRGLVTSDYMNRTTIATNRVRTRRVMLDNG